MREFAAAKEIFVTSQTCNLPPSQEYKGCWSGGGFGRVTCSSLFLGTKGQPVYLLLLNYVEADGANDPNKSGDCQSLPDEFAVIVLTPKFWENVRMAA